MTARTFDNIKGKAIEETIAAVSTGVAAASMISGGIGVLFIGLMTTLAEASAPLKTALILTKPVGPLSGKTLVGVVAWLISWFLLDKFLKDKDSDLGKVFAITLALIAAGLLLTFPPFFEAFAAE